MKMLQLYNLFIFMMVMIKNKKNMSWAQTQILSLLLLQQKISSFISTRFIFKSIIVKNQEYKTNGAIQEEKYKEKLLFTMKEFVLFIKDHQ